MSAKQEILKKIVSLSELRQELVAMTKAAFPRGAVVRACGENGTVSGHGKPGVLLVRIDGAICEYTIREVDLVDGDS